MAPVTTDWQVAKALNVRNAEKKLTRFSAKTIADKLELESTFQITARLKGMERRGFVNRNDKGLWALTKEGWALAMGEEPKQSDRVGIRSGLLVGGTFTPTAPDDKDVPRLYSGKGWTLKYLWFPGRTPERVSVYIEPTTGQEYTEARYMECADLIFESPRGLSPMRLKKVEKSSVLSGIRRKQRMEDERVGARAEF